MSDPAPDPVPADEAEPEVLEPDEVTSPTPPAEPGAAVEKAEPTDAERANQALVAASDAALTMPGVPGRDEFLALAMQARILSMSGAAPKLVRDNPHLAFHVAMVGRDLGISPSAALELIDVIDGQGGPQLSLSPQLLNGQIRRLGLGSIIPVIRSEQRCVAVALGPEGFYDPRCKSEWPDHHELCECTVRLFLGEYEFTWRDAQLAQLAGRDCQPGEHSDRCKGRDSVARGMRCNTGYVTYPKRMLWWRASGFLADDIFPEASLGLYSPEALGAVVDEQGRPVDPADVELPAGYEPKAVGRGGTNRTTGRATPPAELAPQDERDDLSIRIAALPAEQRAVLKERWNDSNRLRGQTVAQLGAGELNLATSMVKGFETIAKRAGWDADAARAEVEARRAADAEESPAEPDADESPALDESPGEPADAGEESPGEVIVPDEVTHPGPDREVAAWVAEVADAAPADLRDSVVAEVKALHHATLNTELKERGWTTEGAHIDTRRMVLTAARLEEALYPNRCRLIGCTEDRAPAKPDEDAEPMLCAEHTPF